MALFARLILLKLLKHILSRGSVETRGKGPKTDSSQLLKMVNKSHGLMKVD